jgi:rRNA-processing protein FCF1
MNPNRCSCFEREELAGRPADLLAFRGVRDLLPNTRDLLVILLEGLQDNTPNLPEVRMGKGSRSGCRFWHYGPQKKAFEGRRPAAEFEELRAAGLLRKLRVDPSTGTYFAFTPEAFRERDAILKSANTAPSPATRKRPENPAPELLAAQSRLVILGELRDEAKSALRSLLEASVVEDRFEPGSMVITAYPWKWKLLAPETRPLLGEARKAAEHWLGAAQVTLDVAGPEHRGKFDELAETIRRIYIRGSNADGPVREDMAGNLLAVEQAVDEQFALVEELPGVHESPRLMLVPDTNALLQDPEIEEWEVGKASSEIVIVSQVQAELDSHKNSDRKTAGKAAKLIRKFKEYGRRGDTLAGVALAGQRRFREIPVRPDMSLAPNWLDASEADDGILAAALEIASRSPSSTVVLVTRDRGLQNKARAAGLPAVDVDDL